MPTRPRSIQKPPLYISRHAFQFADPTSLQPEQWRLVAREPINKMAQRFIVRELCALRFTITSEDRKDKRPEEYTKTWDEKFENEAGFQVWLSRTIEDVCTLPFGAASEVGYEGQKELAWVQHVDAATLVPTYNKRLPYMQFNPDNTLQRIHFTGKQLPRLRVNPRTDIRYKEYQTSPTEDAFLSIEALARMYTYYMQQLTDTPPPGILDLMDMPQDEAQEWAVAFREMITGIDAIKIPVLYEHSTAAKWIPFGRTPQDVNLIEQFKRFAEMLLGKYGLSIGDLRLFEHDSTKAGGRISQLVTERSGIGFWASVITGFINRILQPTELKFEFRQPRPERELIVAQRQQTQLATLQAAAGGKPVITVEDALEQAKEWEIFSVEVEVPEEEEPPPMLLPGDNGAQVKPPTDEEAQTEEVRDQLTDIDLEKKGGAGSANFGHSGRPGTVGGSGTVVPAPTSDARRMAATRAGQAIEMVALRQGMSAAAVEAAVYDKVLAITTVQPVAIRVPVEAAVAVLEEGRFKSQFETETSGGVFDPETRALAEDNGLGVAWDVADADRPIYGYIPIPGQSTSDVSVYGALQFVLKPEVRSRTTVTLGDSLQEFDGQTLIGVPATNPTKEGWDGQVQTAMRDLGKLEYIEAQIHGQVRLKDIAYIRVGRGGFERETGEAWQEVESIANRAAALGIRVEYDPAND